VAVAVWGDSEVALVRSCWKLPLCPTEPVPASSEMHPLLAKAEPISDGGSAFVVTCLRRGEEPAQQQLQQGREVRICERNNSAHTKVSEGGGRRRSRCRSRHSPAACDEDHGEVMPLQPMEVHGGADTHLYPVEDPMPEQVVQRRL